MNNILILWDPSVHIPPNIQNGSDIKQASHSLEEQMTENGLGHHLSHPHTKLPFH